MKFKVLAFLPLLALLFTACQVDHVLPIPTQDKVSAQLSPTGSQYDDSQQKEERLERCNFAATVTDLNGEGGCGYVFKLRTGEIVFATNERELPLRLTEGLAVYVSFKYDSREYPCTIAHPVYVECISLQSEDAFQVREYRD